MKRSIAGGFVPSIRPLLSAAMFALVLACTRGPNLTPDVVARRAMAAAVKEGYALRDYHPPVIVPPAQSEKRWAVRFEGLDGKPGHHFLVWVEDRTGDAQVVPGA